jgi:Protein of unknown function (DUF692)
MRPALEEVVPDIPPSPFNNFTDCWIGIGLRASHYDHPVIDPVWKLYSRAIERAGITTTLLEWDDNIPSFDEVRDET